MLLIGFLEIWRPHGDSNPGFSRAILVIGWLRDFTLRTSSSCFCKQRICCQWCCQRPVTLLMPFKPFPLRWLEEPKGLLWLKTSIRYQK
jgi:hypothetical protein